MTRLAVLGVVMLVALVQGLEAYYLNWSPVYSEPRAALPPPQPVVYPLYRTALETRRPMTSRATSRNRGSIMIEEDNMLCSKFYCDKKSCCSGECTNVFGIQMCIVLSNKYNYGRRR